MKPHQPALPLLLCVSLSLTHTVFNTRCRRRRKIAVITQSRGNKSETCLLSHQEKNAFIIMPSPTVWWPDASNDGEK